MIITPEDWAFCAVLFFLLLIHVILAPQDGLELFCNLYLEESENESRWS